LGVKENPLSAAAGLEKLQVGEQAAILLAESMKAHIILLDEKAARPWTGSAADNPSSLSCSLPATEASIV
jgi:predicted nucleic acid-binding protein